MTLSLKSPVLGLIALFTVLGVSSQGYIAKQRSDLAASSESVRKSVAAISTTKKTLAEFELALANTPDELLPIEKATSEVLLGLYNATAGTSVRINSINSEAFAQGRSPQAAAKDIPGLGVKKIELVLRMNWRDYQDLKLFSQKIAPLPLYVKQGKVEKNNVELIVTVVGV